MEIDRIRHFLSGTQVVPIKLTSTEREAVIHALEDRLDVDVETGAPWDTEGAPAGFQIIDGWKRVPDYAGAPCFVFSRGAATIWKFSDGDELLRFLSDVPPFEFYVCDDAGSYLICCNDHDFIVGWGGSHAWTQQLQPR